MYYVLFSLIQAIQIFRSADFLSFTLAKYFSFHDFPIGYLFLGGGEALSPEKLAYQERH